MAVSWAQHKPMIAEADRAGITVGRRMPHIEDRHRVASSVFAARLAREAVCRMVIVMTVCWKVEHSFWRHFICPDAEPRQGSWAKGMG
jgi:hypothetical protein